MIKTFSFLFSLLLIHPAFADTFATDWSPAAKSRARLLAAGAEAPGHFRAAIDIELSPQTLTYWRNPGEAGLPPVVSFDGSENVVNAVMLFPAPKALLEAGTPANGYEGQVIFPIDVVAADPSKPVTLRYRLDYAVCEKMCIPAKAAGSLTLSPEPGPYAAIVAAARAHVPKPQALGAADALSVVSAHARKDENGSAAEVDVAVRAPAGKDADLFAETSPDLFASIEKVGSGSGADIRQFRVKLEPSSGKVDWAGQSLRLTLVSDEMARETIIALDAVGLTP